MSYLETALGSTRARIAALAGSEADLRASAVAARPPRNFVGALRATAEIAVIAEIKRATPSKGDLSVDLDAGKQAEAYRAGGAAAISVLTEPDLFKGGLEDLAAADGAGLPLLRKDFILAPIQVLEARAAGADAVLLIVKTLGGELTSLVAEAADLGMHALVEVTTEAELERALAAGATLVGVNHRDLETFEIDAHRTATLAPLVPADVTLVALSGVSSAADLHALHLAGAHAALVGETLVRAADPALELRRLRGVA